MASGRGGDSPHFDLDESEVALVIGEEDSSMSVRVVSGKDLPPDTTDLPVASEIVLALATRLLKDPDFHDEVLDWYYAHQDDEDDEGEDEEEAGD